MIWNYSRKVNEEVHYKRSLKADIFARNISLSRLSRYWKYNAFHESR